MVYMIIVEEKFASGFDLDLDLSSLTQLLDLDLIWIRTPLVETALSSGLLILMMEVFSRTIKILEDSSL